MTVIAIIMVMVIVIGTMIEMIVVTLGAGAMGGRKGGRRVIAICLPDRPREIRIAANRGVIATATGTGAVTGIATGIGIPSVTAIETTTA